MTKMTLQSSITAVMFFVLSMLLVVEGSKFRNRMVDRHILAVVAIVAYKVWQCSPAGKIPYCTSALTGADFYKETITTKNPTAFSDVARMDRKTFRRLGRLLTKKGGLTASKNCKIKVCCGEKILMFIHLLKGFTMRELSNRFQHSTSTVHNNLHQVAKALMKCKHMLYFVPSINEEVHSRLLDPKYRFFNMPGKQLVGCYDGTHIDAIPPPGEESAFRNRKHGVTQNVLGVCNFDMLFQYGHYGWEGSAHDGKVFLDAFNKGFPWREGQYYLADAGYALRK